MASGPSLTMLSRSDRLRRLASKWGDTRKALLLVLCCESSGSGITSAMPRHCFRAVTEFHGSTELPGTYPPNWSWIPCCSVHPMPGRRCQAFCTSACATCFLMA